MKLNGTHHQSPRVHDRLMKSTSPRLDDHLPLYSFYLKLVSISVQNELGRIHFWKNIFLFFFNVHLSLFFVICIKIVSAATILMTCLQKLRAVTLPSSQTIKFLVTKKKSPSQAGDCCIFLMFCVSTTEKVLVWFFFFFWLIEEQVWFCCGIWWQESEHECIRLCMYRLFFSCFHLNTQACGQASGLGGTGSGSDLDLIWTWSGSDSVWIWSEEKAADSVVFFNYSDHPNFIAARLRWSISRDRVTANISMAETEPLK